MREYLACGCNDAVVGWRRAKIGSRFGPRSGRGSRIKIGSGLGRGLKVEIGLVRSTTP